ncbi:copper-translocating P-type ATPase [Leptolyngbya sp. FACHB-541]|uniref:heavy metal translocating P-type ATPase n=1 Tax=Leptolyngbya sp. FACHB-541 TaxID=2692810 RepID=UPI0016845415|nr:heavy metal translocating P-type ATPase [Leptolyngbya sp. FACHB-541]MBD1999388.1 copper-translocating P-type ATPase [Leptolyngbya sp. FACHB-541]
MQVSPPLSTTTTASDTRYTVTLDVSGMKCAGCVKAVENQLVQHPGVVSATVNLVTEVATVECEPGQVDPAKLAERVTEIGFPTQPRAVEGTAGTSSENLPDLAERQRLETRQHFQRVAIAATLLLLSTIGHLDHFSWGTIPLLSNIWFHFGLATLTLIFPGRPILIDGWKGLRHNIPNMNTLVSLGTLTAYTASTVALFFPQLGWECFFDEPVMLLGFILLGRTLEQQARSRAAIAFQSLLALKPTLARLIKDTGERTTQISEPAPESSAVFALHPENSVEIPAEQVQVGAWLQVLPGEKIPVDGEVVAGQTTVNEAMLTGEAMPVLKQPGNPVIAGSLNQSGAIALKATRTGKDTTLSQIIALVEAAQTRKAPIQRLADTVAGYFTYGVMAIALLTFLFWYFVGIPLWGGEWGMGNGQWVMGGHGGMAHSSMAQAVSAASPLLLSLKLAIAVLVIACPCALGLATPTAILVGSGIGAERGLLIRGGDVLEKVHQLQTVVFDKTGTLTTGQPIVTDCLPLSEISEAGLLEVAAAVERGARHPLAEAIQQQAQQQGVASLPAQNFYTEPGFGVSAQVAGQQVVLGTQSWLTQQSVEVTDAAQQRSQVLAAAGKTVVYVAIEGQLAGLIGVQDTLRPDAKATVERLRRMGLRVVLLTGDQRAVAEAIAIPLGLVAEDVLAEVRPDGKAAAIAQIQAEGQFVAMVGDGINDAPALAQADVGISLNSATDVAIEAAEIVLMRDRLIDVVESIQLSRATFNKIRQNLFWAFAYNTLGIPIAAGVLLPSLGVILSPATAGAFMAFSSVSVVTNSLLLRRTTRNI